MPMQCMKALNSVQYHNLFANLKSKNISTGAPIEIHYNSRSNMQATILQL